MKTFRLLVLFLMIILPACHSRDQLSDERILTLRIAHGPEIRSYLSSLREQFYVANPVLGDGTKVKIEFISEMGVTAARRIAVGELKTHAWISPSLSLVDYANLKRVKLGAKQSDCLKLFETPVIVAVRPENAILVGANNGRISWRKLMDNPLSSNDKNSPFRLALSHAQPHASTTGLASVIQMAYLAAGKSLLTRDILQSSAVISRLQAYEKTVYAYPLSESYLLSKTAASSSKQVRLAITTEQQLAQYNQRRGAESPELMPLLFEEGSYLEDYSICYSQADWVTPAHQAALKVFADFLVGEYAQRAAEKLGFRLVRAAPAAQGGVPDQRSKLDLPTQLPQVSGELIAQILGSWQELRRPAAVVLVLDTSGSMEGDFLSAGKEQFRKLLAQSSPRDQKAILTFGSDAKLIADFSSDPARLIPDLDLAQSVGGSAIYDGLKEAFDAASDPKLEPFRKTILMYTDGDDNCSNISLASLLGIVHETATTENINLIIIAVKREGSDFSDLERIVQATDGTLQSAALVDLEPLFQEVAKAF